MNQARELGEAISEGINCLERLTRSANVDTADRLVIGNLIESLESMKLQGVWSKFRPTSEILELLSALLESTESGRSVSEAASSALDGFKGSFAR